MPRAIVSDTSRTKSCIPKNVFGQGGHQDHLPASLSHMLYCIVSEEQYNLVYFFVKQNECARVTPNANLPYGMFLTRLYRHIMEHYPHLDNGIYNVFDRVMRPLALKQTQKPKSDCGKARQSVSSTSAYHNYGSSSHQGDDDEDDGASRASTLSPTTYLNSCHTQTMAETQECNIMINHNTWYKIKKTTMHKLHVLYRPSTSNKLE
uniref:Pentatricopeptide repeat-containing protein n=1 Tax=Tanacetum cinerariifolium TaxID=118510 RepID=A0A699HFM1_TANCI|nr:pentatricopeptide repeat-containing protein [Tanacetum cinerariifolium]